VAGRRELSGDESKTMLSVVADYSFALDLLDDYDHQRVAVSGTTPGPVTPLDYKEARRMVNRLAEKFGSSNLFGREKDESLKGTLGAVMQTFGGKDVYPSIEEKAANLLYFLIQDHPFVDGNKRIADTALVAMTLLIAESKPAEKEIMTRVLVNIITRRKA
jgi:hypothetical protein